MKIRYFFAFILVYLILVGGYTFYITTDYYTLHNTLFAPFHITLPIALWVSLPAIVLFLFALLFMSFSALGKKFHDIALHRDIEKILTQIQEQMLGNPVREKTFSQPELKMLSKILQRFYLLPNTKTGNVGYEKIDSLFEAFSGIQNGTYQAKIKLNSSHPLHNVNVKNAINNDVQKAFETLKQPLNPEIIGSDFYIDTNVQNVYEKAWEILLQGQGKMVQKALSLPQNHLTFMALMQLVGACAKGSMNLQKDSLLHACKSVTLTERQYLALAIEVCQSLNQNNINLWLSVFESLSKEIEASVFAYFYILLEVGKTNEAMDLKQQYPKDDFLPVSAFSILKEKGYPLLVFFDPLLYRARKAERLQAENAQQKQIQFDYANH